ncbi:MAG: tetratricopeptide repeat protein [Chlamydiia bacterium]|nr:tetratricopeptide repeat protein [Chlamydiia bacterium]
MSVTAKLLLSLAIVTILAGCVPRSTYVMEPCLAFAPNRNDIRRLDSAFEPLTVEERQQEWGRELTIAMAFAHDNDLYRAVTTFKRALILIPPTEFDRRHQIEFDIMQCYYMANKYCDALGTFQETTLNQVTPEFSAFPELLIMLYDCYLETGECEQADRVLQLIEKGDSNTAKELALYTLLKGGNISYIRQFAPETTKAAPVEELVTQYCCCYKSPDKARMLNAILPGAGYHYVGLKRSAVTSFAINALFIGATYYFFDHGNYAAGLITASLETGWYFGGINGAGLAAKEYNEQFYNCHAKSMMVRNDLFPFLIFQTSF